MQYVVRILSLLFVIVTLAAACGPFSADEAEPTESVEARAGATEAHSAAASPSTATRVRTPPELDWIASANAISYMEAETDNVWITLSCEQGSGRIRIEEPLREQPTSTINLVSGDTTESYTATMGRADEELGFPAGATADTRSATPLMRRFRQTAELRYQGGRQMTVQTETERQLIEAFFARCG